MMLFETISYRVSNGTVLENTGQNKSMRGESATDKKRRKIFVHIYINSNGHIFQIPVPNGRTLTVEFVRTMCCQR